MFLGPQPLDEHGKQDVGHGMVWAANGFRCVRPGCLGLQVVLCAPLKLLHVQHEAADGSHLTVAKDPNSISLPSAPLCALGSAHGRCAQASTLRPRAQMGPPPSLSLTRSRRRPWHFRCGKQCGAVNSAESQAGPLTLQTGAAYSACPSDHCPSAVPCRPSVFHLLENGTKPMQRMLLDSIQVAAADVL